MNMEAPVALTGIGKTDAVIAVGVRTVPYVRDHRVQDMMVLPGSFYLDWALSAYASRFGVTSATIRNAVFQSPILLRDADTQVTVTVTDCGPFVEYMFYEQATPDAISDVPRRIAARLEVHALEPASVAPESGSASRAAFQADATDVIAATRLYETLHANGNQYGPSFQQVSTIWRHRDRALAEIRVPRHDGASAVRPLLIDAAIHSLSAFTIDQGQAFVLRSLERLDVL
jgi:acyl transferase domain-containing protein